MSKKVIIIAVALIALLIAIFSFTQYNKSTIQKASPQNQTQQDTILDYQDETTSDNESEVSTDSSTATIDAELDSTIIPDEDFSDL